MTVPQVRCARTLHNALSSAPQAPPLCQLFLAAGPSGEACANIVPIRQSEDRWTFDPSRHKSPSHRAMARLFFDTPITRHVNGEHSWIPARLGSEWFVSARGRISASQRDEVNDAW